MPGWSRRSLPAGDAKYGGKGERAKSPNCGRSRRCSSIARIRAAAHRDIYSGAGHDACNLALIAPTAMIFVPCEKSISHNELENARAEDLAAGCDVLLQVLLERAGEG